MKLKIKVFCWVKLFYGGVGWIIIKNFENEFFVSFFCFIKCWVEKGGIIDKGKVSFIFLIIYVEMFYSVR